MNRRRSAAGFTLVELTIALAVMAILMGAMASAILVASRATPAPQDPTVATLAAASEVDVLVDDLRYATGFAALQPHVVQFTVPDRTGDNAPEEMRYEWSGVPGEPLRRQMNGGTWTDVVPSVHSLTLSYNTRAVVTTETVSTTVTSPEILFASFNGWPGVTPIYNSTPLATTSWGAEYFVNQAVFPQGARNIRISRVQLLLQKAAAAGSITVGIHRPVGGGDPTPTGSPLGTPATVAVSSLPASFGWVDITMPADVVVGDSNRECVIVTKGTVANAAYWRMFYSTAAPADTPVGLWTTDSGATWQPKASSRNKQDYPFYVYGTYQIDSTEDVTTTTYYLLSVAVSLQTAGTTSPPLATAVEIYSQPQVTP